MYSVYKITNRMNGMGYIGVTKRDVKTRWRSHFAFAEKGLKYPLAQAIRDDGRQAFDVTTIAQTETQVEAYEKERAAITLFGTLHPHGYNLALGGAGLTGRVFSEETRAKIRAARAGQVGHIPGLETRRKQSERRKGSKNYQARPIVLNGVHYPCIVEAAQITGISVSSIRYRLKTGKAEFTGPRKAPVGWGKWNIGSKASAETRAKMSAARKGSKNWNARVVEIDGSTYPSTTDAMDALHLTRNQIRGRIRKGTARYLTETRRVH